MITTASDLKHHFGKYLKHVTNENDEIIIAKNNTRVARLVPYDQISQVLRRHKITTKKGVLGGCYKISCSFFREIGASGQSLGNLIERL